MTALTYDEDIVDLSAHEIEEEDEEETWHVQLAPGDVRVLSLDQLDDMYRLDLISDETMVWKDGMGEWKPLAVVLAEEEEPAESYAPSSFAPAPLAQLPSFAPAPLAPLPSFAPAPLAPVKSLAPAPLAPVSYAPAALSPSPSFAPAPLAPVSFAPAPLAPVKSFAPTTPPVAFSVPAAPPRAGAGERWMIGLAMACGLIATLHRNDVISDVAHSAKQDAAFQQAEQSLFGGPSFGTLRSVQQLIEQHALRLPEVRVPLTAEMTATAPAAPAPVAEAPAPVKAAPPEAPKPAAEAPEAKAALVAGALRGNRVEPKQAAAPARATRALPPPKKGKGDSVIPGSRPTRGRSAEYDPLNGNL